MTISHESASPNKINTPSANPPPYNEYDSIASSQSIPPRPVHNEFGPTPLTTQALTPYAYYDARSPYSLAQADSRARWRFIVTLLWALALWFAFGCLVSVQLTTRRHSGWQSRMYTIAAMEGIELG
ncbi:hypothetical protein L208DRAFT_1386869 [Tricholoma matsutake]|nr:hypothetical protein L208DRAFT_1386869 [Tricholoma matsutake 945]